MNRDTQDMIGVSIPQVGTASFRARGCDHMFHIPVPELVHS